MAQATTQQIRVALKAAKLWVGDKGGDDVVHTAQGHGRTAAIYPDSVILDGVEMPAARIEVGRFSGSGAFASQLRSALRAAGLEIR